MRLKEKSRAEIAGEMQADAIMEVAHLTYNAARGRRMVETCIKKLQKRISELQPKEADPKYKEARYGKKTSKQKV